jgi:pectate lyase
MTDGVLVGRHNNAAWAALCGIVCAAAATWGGGCSGSDTTADTPLGSLCSVHSDCEDHNACTDDRCDAVTGTCFHAWTSTCDGGQADAIGGSGGQGGFGGSSTGGHDASGEGGADGMSEGGSHADSGAAGGTYADAGPGCGDSICRGSESCHNCRVDCGECAQPSVLPSFPSARGSGAVTAGGRKGRIIEVTTLADSGPGSLREAVEAQGARIVVFRVGGTIHLQTQLRIRNNSITIAGQTAPGGGILIEGTRDCDDVLRVDTHDVVLRFLRVRVGCSNPLPQSGDAITFYGGVQRVIVDHVSLSWSLDETFSIWANDARGIEDITLQWSILAEPLLAHSTNFISGGQTEEYAASVGALDVHHTLFTNTSHRQPLIKTPSFRVVNNIFYNWGFYATQAVGHVTFDVVGNLYRRGPLSAATGHEVQVASTTGWEWGTDGPSLYISGNLGPNNMLPGGDNWNMVADVGGENGKETGSLDLSYRRGSPMSPLPIPIEPDPASTLQDLMLSTVGASLRLDCDGSWVESRDSVDTRLLQEFQNGTGSIPATVAEAGGFPVIEGAAPCADRDHDGMPDVWESAHGLNPDNSADADSDSDGDGYTNVEEYLNGA